MPEYRFDEIAINSKEKKKPTEEDKYTYIGLEHLDTGSLTVSRWGSEIAPTGEKLVMRKGDVLFGKRRAYQKKVAIAPFDGIFSAHGMVLRPREEVITKDFFPLFISSDYFLDEAIKISVGSLSPTINWSDLKELTFTIPTLEEQKKLAPVIWAAIDTKSAYKKLLLGIDELVKSQFIERFGDAVNGKEKYPLLSLKDVCSIIQDGEHATVKRVDKGNLFISARNIKTDHQIVLDTVTYINDENFAKIRKRFAPKKDDILLTCAGTIGNSAIVPELPPFVADRGLTMLRPDDSKVLSEYLHASIVSDYVQEQMRQGTQATALAHLYLNKINAIKIIVPTIEKQKEFVEFLQQSDKSKFELTQAISRIDDMIKALMQG